VVSSRSESVPIPRAMTVFNRIFLISAFVIAVADVALATETSSPGMFIGSLALALLAAALVLRQRRTAGKPQRGSTTG
jgi:MYXO-CTERM domain-containing protein